VAGISCDKLLTKEKDSPVSIVLVLSIVGLSEVYQQTPFEIISAPPSSVIIPPETAVLEEISVAGVVDKIGGTGFSLQEWNKSDVKIRVDSFKVVLISISS
jgi:hypothetical protein